MAMGAILAAFDHGLRVPEDLSVIGIDNHDFAESFGLTTMAQDPFEQGAVAARILLDELNGGEPRARSLKMPVTLIERASTAPPRHPPDPPDPPGVEHRKKHPETRVSGAFSCARALGEA